MVYYDYGCQASIMFPRESKLFPLFYRNQTAMQQCWHGNPDDRPTFSQLQSQLGAILSAMTGYLELLDITVADDQEEHTYF